ncbi:MAG: GAF domain-containing protein [Anaerolineales bacterium]
MNKSNLSNTKPVNLNESAFDYKQWRETFILTILRIVSVLGIALIISSYSTTTIPIVILYVVMYAVILAVTFLPIGYNTRAYVFLAILILTGLNALVAWGPLIDGSLFLITAVVFASLLFDSKVDIFVFAISIAIMVLLAVLGNLGFFTPIGQNAPIPTTYDWIVYIADFTVPGISLLIATSLFKQAFANVTLQMQRTLATLNNERAQLENKIKERTEELEAKSSQFRASTLIARNIAELQSVPSILDAVVASTADQFGYYHVGIYLLDERKKVAFLQASSSMIGQQLIGQGHYIEKGERNPISIVVEQKQPYMASDIGTTLFIKDASFPITRSRLSIPLIVRNDIIGILDMHSDQTQTFNTQDVEILQILSDLIAISIDNVHLLNDTKTLVQQLELYTSSQTYETWAKHTSRNTPAYQYTPAGVRPIFAQTKKQEPTDDALLVPLSLQGQNIGKITLLRKGTSSTWSDKERIMVEKIAEQISLALENSRLVDEAQRNAQRDQLIANISSRIRETLDVESVIRTATTEFRKVFDLKEAEISIGLPQAAPPKPTRKQTSSLKLK